MRADHTWLDAWSPRLKDKKVLELGCGSGIDTAVLSKLTNNIVACDLNPPEGFDSQASVLHVDHSQALPFADDEFEVVVASLCLHYFSWSITQNILKEISRILHMNGLLLCRLNSENDINYGAIGHTLLEAGMYNVNGEQKRFFSREDIEELFLPDWRLENIEEKTIDRYKKEKVVWEFGAINALYP